MSKLKVSKDKSEAPKNKVLAHINKGIEQCKKLGAMRGVTACFAIFFTAMAWHFANAEGASTAMLYLLANNGKLSGRADGNVYMRNGRVRGFKVPSIVRNGYTGIARTNLASLSSAWNSLTNLERGSWNTAAGISRTNRFGQEVPIKGKELFVSFNTNLMNASQPVQSAFLPTIIAPSAMSALSGNASQGGGTFTLNFATTPTAADVTALVYATRAFSAGTYKPSQSAYRLIQALPAASATGVTIFANYTGRFGALSAGSKIFLRTVMINETLGRPSAPQDAAITVVV